MKKKMFVAIALILTTCAVVRAQQDAPRSIDLFASQNLADWDFFLDDPGLKKEDVWSFNSEGSLVCKGEPIGYLCTKESYKDFKLTIEWRWPKGTAPTNSGVLMRISGKPRPLPYCVEGQLHHGNAGDIWAFHGFELEGFDKKRFRGPSRGELTGEARGNAKLLNAEKPAGEWNTYEILCQDDILILCINGVIVNWAKDLDEKPGKIGLQSEGGLIEFRNAILTPLPSDDVD